MEHLARSLGACCFGVADLKSANEFIVKQGRDFLNEFPRAISVGFRLLDSIVDQLYLHHNPMAVATYIYHIYHVVNPRLDRIALEIARILQEQKYKAYVVPSSQMVSVERLEGLLSHKLAAHLAGIGWIGKSALLITPESGPRVRWVTILTDAPLTTGEPMDSRCGKCTICIEGCPVGAFSGVDFGSSKSRGDLMDAHKCYQYCKRREKTIGTYGCGMCVYVCPYGRAKRKRRRDNITEVN